MTKYKDLPDRKVAGRFNEENAYKRYGQEEVVYDDDTLKNNIPLADLIARIYSDGEDITKEEYLSK